MFLIPKEQCVVHQPALVHLSHEPVQHDATQNKLFNTLSSRKKHFHSLFYDDGKNFMVYRKSVDQKTLSIVNFAQQKSESVKNGLKSNF